MRSPQDCVSLLAVIDKLRQADLGIQWGAAESILQVVANACLNNAVFGKFEAGQFDLDTFYLTMSQIAQQLVLLYHERGGLQYTEDELMHRLNEFLREYSHTTGERALQQTISELIESKTPPQSEGEKLSALVLLFWEQPELVCLIEEYRLLLATRLTPQGPNVLAPWPRFMDFCQRLIRFFYGYCAEKSLTESSRLLSDLFTGFWYEIDASLLANLSANFSFRKTERQYQVRGMLAIAGYSDLLHSTPWAKRKRSDIAQKVQVLFYSMVIECIMEKPEVKGLSTFQQAALLRELLLYYDCYRDQQQSTFLGAGVAANRESAVLPIYTASAKQLIQWGRATNIADLVWFYELIQTASVRHSGQRVEAENFCSLQSVVQDQTDILTEIIVRRLADLDAPEHLTSLQEWTRAGLPVRDLLARWRFKRADYSEPEPNSEYRERAVHRRKETAELVLNLMKALPTYKRLGQQGELLEIVTLLEANISLREAMQRQTLEHLWKKAGTFEARLALAFEHPFSRREMTLKRRLIEEEMGSEVEVQAVAGRIRQNFDDLYGEGDEVLAVEQIRYFFGKRYSFETLNILLHTHSSDHNLKNTISSILDEDGFLVGAPKGEEVVVRLRHELHSIDAMLDQLYSLPLPIRLYVIKKFLIDGKLIVEPKERQRLYKLFLDETIVASEQNSAFATVMRNVAQAMAATTIWEPIFHAITPTLAEHIARPPQAQTPWTSFGFPHMAQRAELID
ncbi:MAG TPA: hypothetical protein VJC18_05325, partial [bacterium]|nr:hypothetical protein [bacterium]